MDKGWMEEGCSNKRTRTSLPRETTNCLLVFVVVVGDNKKNKNNKNNNSDKFN